MSESPPIRRRNTVSSSEEGGSATKRTAQACERCRLRKVRCSGTSPCTHCRRAASACVFGEETQRISISTRYLRQLREEARVARDHQQSRAGSVSQPRSIQAQAQAQNQTQVLPPATPRSLVAGIHDTPEEQLIEDGFERNPLVEGAHLVRGKTGAPAQQWYLGPSSTWSFSRRVIAHIEENTSPLPGLSMPVNLDGAAYSLAWDPPWQSEGAPPLCPQDVPSLDYATYLFNTVQFFINQNFHFIDEDIFVERLEAFYRQDEDNRLPILWYAQFLFVLAFGKAFTSHAGSRALQNVPKGWLYASKAFALLPSFHDPEQDNLLAIEVFCLAALYLQSIDMRVTAFEFAGRALRLCYVTGIHNTQIAHDADRNQITRCAYLWWSVYMLDQHLSALMGAPSAIQDDDVAVPLPMSQDPDPRAAALGTNVRLSRVLARVVRTVYNVQATLDGSFLLESQKLLRSLADISLDVHNTVGASSRVSSHMILSYHHCIVLATRPVVMCILARFIQNVNTSSRVCEPTLSPTVGTLLHTCTDSATTILLKVQRLNHESLLETFLPFHLEQVFSAALVLYIVSAIWPDKFPERSIKAPVGEILDCMIAGGHNLAALRKSELSHLAALLARFMPTTSSEQSTHTFGSTDLGLGLSGTMYMPPDSFESNTMWGLSHNSHLTELAGILTMDDMDAQIIFSPS